MVGNCFHPVMILLLSDCFILFYSLAIFLLNPHSKIYIVFCQRYWFLPCNRTRYMVKEMFVFLGKLKEVAFISLKQDIILFSEKK